MLPDEFLKNAFEEPKGGWLRQDVIDTGLTQLEEFYSNTGYMFARIDRRDHRARRTWWPTSSSSSTRATSSGSGASSSPATAKTKDRVLRRSLRVQEGMVFNSGQLKNSMFRINQLEYFKVNEEDPVELDIDSDEKKVNLTIKGDEAERTELTFGGGYSEIDGFFLQGGIRTRNFLGRGETLAVQLQTGRYTEQFDVSYFIPWLRDKPQNVGFQLFKRDLDYDLYASQRFVRKEEGGSVTYQRVVGPWSNVSLSYSNAAYEDFRSFNFFGDDSTTVSQEFDFTRSSINLGWTYDKRDSSDRADPWPLHARQPRVRRRLPRRRRLVLPAGARPHLLQEAAAGRAPDGGRHQHRGRPDRSVRHQQRRQRPARSSSSTASSWAASRASAASSSGRSGPATSRPAGPSSRTASPRAATSSSSSTWSTSSCWAARSAWCRSWTPPTSTTTTQSYDLSHLRYSAGVELRINVPLFGAPLRFIWANNIDPLVGLPEFDQERFQSFDFSIGTSF